MLYTQQFTMPANGTFRVGTIGGEPYEWLTEKNRDGSIKPGLQQKQVGYMIPPKVGLLLIKPVFNDKRILDCRASVEGYSGRPVSSFGCPSEVYIELPCSVIVSGPPSVVGAEIIIEAWLMDSVSNSRGASHSVVGDASGVEVPSWGQSVDLGPATLAVFKNNLGAIVGAGLGPISQYSIPNGAATVDISSATPANTTIIFRQEG